MRYGFGKAAVINAQAGKLCPDALYFQSEKAQRYYMRELMHGDRQRYRYCRFNADYIINKRRRKGQRKAYCNAFAVHGFPLKVCRMSVRSPIIS